MGVLAANRQGKIVASNPAAAKLLGFEQADLDGELDRRPVAKLEEHLAQCNDCMREVTALEQLGKVLRANLPRYKAPPNLRARLEGAAVPSELSSRESRSSAYRYWNIAASLFLAFCIHIYHCSGADSSRNNLF